MTVALHNYLKGINIDEFVSNIKDRSSFEEILNHIGLDQNTSIEKFVEHLLYESKMLLNEEKRKEATIILRATKSLLNLVPKYLSAFFYLTLTDSFLLANDYEGASRSVKRADALAKELDDPRLEIRVLNMMFVINRSVGKDKAGEFLLKSREISEKNEFFENIVFCDVNLGLLHFFKKEYSKAAEYCASVMDVVSSKKYPKSKMIMPTDYFLQIFSESPELVANRKNHEMIRKGVKIVLQTIKQFKSDYEATRRVAILVGFLKLSEELMDSSLKVIDAYVEKLPMDKRSLYYSSVANGAANYKDFNVSLIYFEKAITYMKNLNDEEKRRIKKNYAYTLCIVIGASMIYDLETSQQTSQKLKGLKIKVNEDNLAGKKGKTINYRNSVSDSDAVFAVKREFLEKKLLNSIKDMYTRKKIVTGFSYQNSREDILNHLEMFAINALNQNDELLSLLLVGTTINEKDAKKKKRTFTGYQILGHRVPKSILDTKHFEEFDIKFLYDLVNAPQKFKEIEIITPHESLETDYKTLFGK
jgi:hypothetical protein